MLHLEEKMQWKYILNKNQSHPELESNRLFLSYSGGQRAGQSGQEEEKGGKEWSD